MAAGLYKIKDSSSEKMKSVAVCIHSLCINHLMCFRESRLYFNRLLTTKCTMQKLFQLQLTSKKLEIEINRKILNSNDKDTGEFEWFV